jgi:hypothetical protein
MTVDELLARESIRHLMAVYTTAGDRGQAAELARVFAQDGLYETPLGNFRGRAEIERFVKGLAESGGSGARERHHLTTCRIDLEGPDTARGWSYVLRIGNGAIVEVCLYIDRFARIDADWLITHRRIKVEWTAPGREYPPLSA